MNLKKFIQIKYKELIKIVSYSQQDIFNLKILNFLCSYNKVLSKNNLLVLRRYEFSRI